MVASKGGVEVVHVRGGTEPEGSIGVITVKGTPSPNRGGFVYLINNLLLFMWQFYGLHLYFLLGHLFWLSALRFLLLLIVVALLCLLILLSLLLFGKLFPPAIAVEL